ncbi:MAG TPA: ATP-dependent DNA ligase [Candidatus Nanoarchaeia archaeon]|nr:ATP-dependent DNA ligase [Candidatus Nanoarchaeia archaeon]
MDFDQLITLFEKLEKTSSGNSLREILAEFWKEIPVEDIAKISYLTLGQIASQYEDVVLGMAEKMVEKAIAAASGMEAAKVRQILQQEGDIGLAAEKILHQKPRTLIPVGKLTVPELFNKLHKIAAMSGSGSQDQKINLVVAMLQKCSPTGAKYLSRIVLGTLRLGVGDMTVLDSLALAYTGDKKNKVELEAAYNICPDVGVIAETVARKGLKGLAKIEVHVGRPIKMMLAQRVKLLEDLPKKMPGKIAVEGKYDGERVQAHKDKKGKITLFSRRLDDITQQFPDLVKYLEKQIKAKEYVVEGEIVAIDSKGKLLPFQTLMQRRRKHDIEEYIKKIPIQIKIFDALYLNGKSLLKQPYEKRCAQLEKVMSKSEQVVMAEKIVTDDIEKIDQFFKQKLKEGEEGIIAKSLSGEYQAGTRGWNWIKWKKDYAQEMVDTFDLVVVGAYYGRGRRSGTYGALLCAAYNDIEDSFETVCKLGTGMTDEILEELPRLLKKYKVEKKPARVKVKKEMEPEVWFEPKVVVEVLAAEITTSPFHTLGLALRFPRFIKLREDKKAEQATTSEEFREMK